MRTSIPSILFSALVLPLAAAGLSAQNLVTNGDFEGGASTAGVPNGWTAGGFTVAPMVSKFDTTGGGASNSYNHHPGGKTTPRPYPVNWIEQDVLIIQGVTYEFRADISSAAGSGNADGGTVAVLVDGVASGNHRFGGISSNTTERTRLCLQIVPKTTGKKKLRITFHRNYTTHTGTPTVHIDNVFFGLTQGLTVCFPGERKAGSTMRVSALGTAGNRFGIFVSVKNTTPYPIGSWTGQWALANPFLPLVIANLDTTGRWSLSATAPASAKGVKVWFQGIQASKTNLHMGYAQEVNLY